MEHTPVRRLRNLLTNGNLWLYVLSLISTDGELYAYSLDKKIEERFSFRPNRIMIYVVLYKLESEGLIESRFRERRKYYRLTRTGEDALARAREYFVFLSKKL